MLQQSTESLKKLLITWSTVWICLHRQTYRKNVFWPICCSLKTLQKVLNSLNFQWSLQYALKIPMHLFTYDNILYPAASKAGLVLPCVSLQILHKSLCTSSTIKHILLLWLLWLLLISYNLEMGKEKKLQSLIWDDKAHFGKNVLLQLSGLI